MQKFLLLTLALIVAASGCVGQTQIAGIEEGPKIPQPEIDEHVVTGEQPIMPLPAIRREISYAPSRLPELKQFVFAEDPPLYKGVRWGPQPIRYFIDTKSSNLSLLPGHLEDIRVAIKFWEEVGEGTISFEEVTSAELSEIQIIYVGIFDIGRVVHLGVADFDRAYHGVLLFVRNGTARLKPRSECNNRVTAAHEIGHLLGLDHSNERDSLMYPFQESCQLKATPDVTETIKALYQDVPNYPDFYLQNATARLTDETLRIDLTVWNIGVSGGKVEISAATEKGELERFNQTILPGEGFVFTRYYPVTGAIPIAIDVVVDPDNAIEEFDGTNNKVTLVPITA